MVDTHEAARVATPLAGWSVGELNLRALSVSDLPTYGILGKDPEFHWDREPKSDEFILFMISFRLEHYRRYGFGIMGVMLAGRLIGQAGLQVIPEEPSKIEMAVFLGAPHRGLGFGRLLNSELMRRSDEAGMRELYGIVRVDNSPALGLMRALGGVECERGVHYGQQAVQFRFDLGA
jgi:RimJ/RimL family protein N-acetyltransferase